MGKRRAGNSFRFALNAFPHAFEIKFYFIETKFIYYLLKDK